MADHDEYRNLTSPLLSFDLNKALTWAHARIKELETERDGLLEEVERLNAGIFHALAVMDGHAPKVATSGEYKREILLVERRKVVLEASKLLCIDCRNGVPIMATGEWTGLHIAQAGPPRRRCPAFRLRALLDQPAVNQNEKLTGQDLTATPCPDDNRRSILEDAAEICRRTGADTSRFPVGEYAGGWRGGAHACDYAIRHSVEPKIPAPPRELRY